MNRENKRKAFEKGYYKTHTCSDTFICMVCGRTVAPENAGSGHRNHCPNCLASLHLDIEPGDRESDCGGIMEPIAVWVRRGGEPCCGIRFENKNRKVENNADNFDYSTQPSGIWSRRFWNEQATVMLLILVPSNRNPPL